MPESEYFSFEEVLNDLKLEEDELKRLVSAGEIRAFRDKNTMRFKAEDIARLRGRRVDSQDVELDDLELDLEGDTEIAATRADDPEALVLEETSVSEELVLEEASPAGEVISLGGESLAPVSSEPTSRASRAGAPGRRAPKAAAASTREPVEQVSEGIGMVVLMMVGAVLLIVANFVVFDAAIGRASSGLTRAVANMFS